MKKILFATLLVISIACFGQDSLSVDSVQPLKSLSSSQISDTTKIAGDSAYVKKDYALAIQIYEALLKEGEAAEIYYNLGNAYYKTGEIAKAILNYERALLLKPGNNDIRANLEIARSKTLDKVEAIPEIFFVTWIKSLINCIGVDVWAVWGIISFLLLIFSLYIFIFSKQILLKKISFISGIAFLIITFCANIFAQQQKEYLTKRTNGIIMSPSITVRSTPSESGTSLFILHEGRKVSIKDNSMKEWKEIRLEDGKVGWIPTNSIEII